MFICCFCLVSKYLQITFTITLKIMRVLEDLVWRTIQLQFWKGSHFFLLYVSKWKENASITHGIKVLKRKESGSQRRNDSRSSYILLIAWFYHFRIHLALFGEVEALYTPWPTNSNPRKLSVTYLRKFSIVLRGHIENNPNVCLVECSIMKMTKSQPHKIAQMKQENQRSKAYVMIPFLCWFLKQIKICGDF